MRNPEIGSAAHGDARGVGLEQVVGIDQTQLGIAHIIERARSQDADAKSELDVGFDYVGIERRVRCQA